MKQKSAEKLQKKKEKEIAKWERERAKPKRPYYLISVLMLCCLVFIVDDIATTIGTTMKTEIANTFFNSEKSIAYMDMLGMANLPILIISMFYKSLSDRYGRKLFLIVNTFGIALGLFFVYASDNLFAYMVGALTIQFFIPHDMQSVYITENAPPKYRATIFAAVKTVSSLGALLLPLLRRIFMSTDAGNWRMVYLVPAIIGFVASFLCLLTARETDAFIEARLAWLNKTEEELKAEELAKQNKKERGQLGKAFKYAWSNKQVRWLFISVAVLNFCQLVNFYSNVIMSYGYAGYYVDNGIWESMDEALNAASIGPITQAMVTCSIAGAIMTFINGFIADRLNRKRSATIFASIMLVSYVLFAYGCTQNWNGYVIGAFLGLCTGAFSCVGFLISMMITESTPTDKRSSVAAATTVPLMVGTGMASVVAIPFIGIFGNTAVPTIVFWGVVPGMVLTVWALLAKTKDTTGVDLSTITGDEFV